MPVGTVIVVGGQRNLLQVVLASGAPRGLAGLLHGGQQESDQQADDRHHHQQLDEGETSPILVAHVHGASPLFLRWLDELHGFARLRLKGGSAFGPFLTCACKAVVFGLA